MKRALLLFISSVAVSSVAGAQAIAPAVTRQSAATVTTPAPETPAAPSAGPRLQPEWRSVPAPTFADSTAEPASAAAASTTIRMDTLTLILVVVILVLLIT